MPEDYEDIEDAKYIFEKHHGQFRWCLIGDVEPATERPIFVLHGVVSGSDVDWKVVDRTTGATQPPGLKPRAGRPS